MNDVNPQHQKSAKGWEGGRGEVRTPEIEYVLHTMVVLPRKDSSKALSAEERKQRRCDNFARVCATFS